MPPRPADNPIVLENPALRVVVVPSQGGMIREITTRDDGDRWLFFDPSRREENQSLNVYDDVWCGGFEELFPNDAPGMFDGHSLEDHGELWSASWDVIDRTESSTSLRRVCNTVAAVVQKNVSLQTDRAAFKLTYSLENRHSKPLFYLFKLHPAMRIEEGDEILLPGGTVQIVDPQFSAIAGSEGPFAWPTVVNRTGVRCDLSRVPPRESGLQEFVYVRDMPSGWCGLRRKKSGKTITFRYPLSFFPYCWLFMSFGGWRGYYTAVLEPCTNVPKDMEAARAAGTCAVLEPGVVKRFSVAVGIE